MEDPHEFEAKTAIAIRTLITAGYSITGSHRQPRHIEIQCDRKDILGSIIPYVIAVTDQEEFSEKEMEDLVRTAKSEGRVLVAIARTPGPGWIAWEDFTEALGGAVPSWQAL